MATTLKFTGDWGKFSNIISPRRFSSSLKDTVGKATKANAEIVAKEAQKLIKSRKYSPNAGLTILIKGGKQPLVESGALYEALGSIAIRLNSWKTAHIVVKRKGNDSVDVASIVHNGTIIKVTDRMRNMFSLLFRVGQGHEDRSKLKGRAAEIAKKLGARLKEIRPIKESTTSIVIPARPFMKDAIENPTVFAKIKKNWTSAVEQTLKASKAARPNKK